MSKLKKLFEPIAVGRVELKNRLVMSPMGLGYAPNDRPGQRMRNFLEERAKGGL